MNTEELEQLKDDLAAITESCAYIKLDENQQLQYVRIDNRKFTNLEKMGAQIIDYSRNIQDAISFMRKYHYLQELPDKIPDFVMKYHPAWITLRQQEGYLNDCIEDGEIHCAQKHEVKTYYEWMSDTFLALGEKEYYPEKLNPETLMTKGVFDSVIGPEVEETDKKTSDNLVQYLHHDTHAFVLATRWKRIIEQGNDEGIDMKNIRYKLDRDSHFPLLVTGTNKNKRTYDFRKIPAILHFTKYLSKQNPGHYGLKSEVKKLNQVIKGY